MPGKRRKREEDKASPDLTPMIDVTFQLLIFFILCTRFRHDERNFQTDLPRKEGLNDDVSPPKEQLTIYCLWDATAQSNTYSVALDARGRKPVDGSFARLDELVIYPSDSASVVNEKRVRYQQIEKRLADALENYRKRSGARIEKFEISFAVKAPEGARSGTAPWLFVSLAIDATADVNEQRGEQELEALPVTFKFSDALGRYSR
jgi:biopolymer transport protein ExbD